MSFTGILEKKVKLTLKLKRLTLRSSNNPKCISCSRTIQGVPVSSLSCSLGVRTHWNKQNGLHTHLAYCNVPPNFTNFAPRMAQMFSNFFLPQLLHHCNYCTHTPQANAPSIPKCIPRRTFWIFCLPSVPIGFYARMSDSRCLG